MSSEWRKTTLGAVSNWSSGGTPTKDEPSFWGGDVPWISANSMHGTRFHDSELCLTDLGLLNGSRLAPPETVLLLVRGGALHNRIPVGMATRQVAFNQDVKALAAKSEIRPWYLLYWLMGHEKFFLDSVVEYTGIGAGKLDTKRMQGLELLLPSLGEQDAIVEVVKAIDDRITLLRETNATLEAIAQALFKSWFVDFDPVRAKMQGRTPEGMDEATAALFPDGLEESALGLVPRGWRVAKLGADCGYLSRGVSPKYIDIGGTLVLNQKCIRDFSVDYGKGRRHDQDQRKIDGRLVAVGDVLVNSTGVGTLGRVAQVLQLPEAAIVDSHVTVVRAGANISWPYLGQWMMRKQPEIEAMGEGSTGQTELSRAKLADLDLLVPKPPLLDEFDRLVISLKERVAVNENSAQTLATLRDTLLPRLISGQLRLPEAAIILENA